MGYDEIQDSAQMRTTMVKVYPYWEANLGAALEETMLHRHATKGAKKGSKACKIKYGKYLPEQCAYNT